MHDIPKPCEPGDVIVFRNIEPEHDLDELLTAVVSDVSEAPLCWVVEFLPSDRGDSVKWDGILYVRPNKTTGQLFVAVIKRAAVAA